MDKVAKPKFYSGSVCQKCQSILHYQDVTNQLYCSWLKEVNVKIKGAVTIVYIIELKCHKGDGDTSRGIKNPALINDKSKPCYCRYSNGNDIFMVN